MKTLNALLAISLIAGCNSKEADTGPLPPPKVRNEAPAADKTLAEARQGFVTKLVPMKAEREAVEEPPAKLFRKVKYESPAGNLAAYITPDPGDGKKHPAIIWITGGDCNSIGDVWTPAKPQNDQTASAFRKAGIAMMFPSLRGGNDNPGKVEGFLGEVDDVLAARDYLEKQSFVDPARIYLGGHSTGGTLVLLVSECSDKFRAVFSFGPADNVKGYEQILPQMLPFDRRNAQEIMLRSPAHWLNGVKSPTYVMEGGIQGNGAALTAMSKQSKNPHLFFFSVPGATHFSILAPTTKLLAQKILKDDGSSADLGITQDEVIGSFGKR